MCARRFLTFIFILILLAVAGAFALYQFGGQVLTRMATPVGHYQEPAKGSGPDYSADSSWIAKPGLEDDPSLWVPRDIAPAAAAKVAATFYVHPTTYLERDRWNAALDEAGDPAARARLFVESQGSAFNNVSEVWAPRYRQAAFGAFLLTNEDATRALDLAYRDVLSAFDRFLSQQPAGRPIILAGHSQGSLHLLRLLKDRRQALDGRLVAAYVAGWPVSADADLPAIGLNACDDALTPGCLLSWQSFADPANTSLVTDAWVGTTGLTGAKRSRESMVCVNPITGRSTVDQGSAANRGTLVPDETLSNATLMPGIVASRCDKGFLKISGPIPKMGPYVLPGNNYHVYDYALFWGSIREDAERRLAQWLAR